MLETMLNFKVSNNSVPDNIKIILQKLYCFNLLVK